MDRPSTVDTRGSAIRGGLSWVRSAHPYQVCAVEAPNPPAASSAIPVVAFIRNRWRVDDGDLAEGTWVQGELRTAADAIGANMARLRRDHFRMLGNGYCARPPQLDCAFESVCENCTFFQSSIQFRTTLKAQHDDAAAKNQTGRRHLFTQLLTGLHQDAS
jgi:hypothetical protein